MNRSVVIAKIAGTEVQGKDQIGERDQTQREEQRYGVPHEPVRDRIWLRHEEGIPV
jgi:hypothetical protein